MSAEPNPSAASPGMSHAVAVSQDAAAVLYRDLVAVVRAFGRHVLAMADLIEAEPFNDEALLAADARFGELHARMKATSEKFAHGRHCVGRVQ